MLRERSDSYAARWAEGREYLRLCDACLRNDKREQALNFLHEAHNLGRDNIPLHALTHLRYIRFSLHESNYRRALGHIFWALTSPLIVPIERKQRTAIVGKWRPAPKKIAEPMPSVPINASSPEAGAQ